MSSKLLGTVLATALALLAAAMPATAAADLSEGITIETSAGPVTCAPDPEHEPGPEAISETPFKHGQVLTVTETGALRCQVPSFGEVEVTGAGLPWTLTLNERTLTARLKGTRKPGLSVAPVALPSLSCLYQTGMVMGTLTLGASPSVNLSIARVRLNKASSALCPPLGPLNLDVALP
jgi:hypothetical protein